MKHLILKLSALFLISTALLVSVHDPLISCAGGEPDDIRDQSLFAPELIGTNKFEPFFLTSEDYYYRNRYSDEPVDDVNIYDWSNYFQTLNKAEIDTLVYGMRTGMLSELLNYCMGLSSSYNGKFMQLKGNSKYIEGLNYLVIAKEMEVLANVDPGSWDSAVYETEKIKAAIPKLLSGLRSAAHKEIRIRFGFQVIRAFALSGQYEKGIEFHEKQLNYSVEDGSMYYRALGYKAFCLYRLKRFSESNLIYARIYDQFPHGRITAFESFHPQEEADWKQTLSIAENDHERELLWHLFGVYADPLKGLTEIDKINPESELSDLLLVRAVNIAEFELLRNPLYEYGYDEQGRQSEGYSGKTIDSWYSLDSTSVLQLTEFVERTAETRQAKKAIWECAAGYLNWLTGSYIRSGEWTKKAQQHAESDELLLGQVRILKLINKISGINKINADDETELIAILNSLEKNSELPLRFENARRFAMRKMGEKYLEASDLLMSELAWPLPDSYYVNGVEVQTMIDLMLKKDRTVMQNYLLGKYPLDISQLYEIQAVEKIYEYDFKNAIFIFKRNANAGGIGLLANPFNIRIKDCHDCDHEMKQKVVYTKLAFAEKMLELKVKGEEIVDAKERATDLFLFANGLYNMTWYGNARLLRQTAVTRNIDDSNRFESYNLHKRESSPYFDCAEAQKYYLKAYELSTDREFKARCAWMAAKCEHNLWLEGDYKGEQSGDFAAGTYFKLMKQKFSDTKYYKEVINECGYFCQFINPGKLECVKNK